MMEKEKGKERKIKEERKGKNRDEGTE